MTLTTSKPRNELRYEIAGEHVVTLIADPDDPHSEPRVFSARMLNLSARGAKLALPAVLPTRTTLRLKLAIPQLATELYATAKVCWSEAGETGEHLIGCRLSPGIPDGLLSRLAASGRLDREESCRHQVCCEFQISREADPWHSRTWATLRNYSPGGFCIQTRKSNMVVGDHIHVFLKQPEPSTLVAVARWSLQIGDDYHWGCRCLGNKSGERLQQAVLAMLKPSGSAE